LRLAQGERTAWLASRVRVVRWVFFGSGLTLAFLLNPATIGVLALAYGVGLLVIPEEREARNRRGEADDTTPCRLAPERSFADAWGPR
jgi:hypothetical protein